MFSSWQTLKGKKAPNDVENIWYSISGNSGNIAERFNSFMISALTMINSSSSGKPYFFFKIFSQSDKFNAVVFGVSVLLPELSSPFK